MRPEIIHSIKPHPVSTFWKFIDISGRTFGRLKVIAYAGKSKWYCLCSCGNKIITNSGSLRIGTTTSCGCYHAEQTKKANTRHGDCNTTTEYFAYLSATNILRITVAVE